MNSKLSFNAIAATLATLGATGLVACGGSAPPAQSPVQAHEVPAASAAPAEAACGAAPTQTKNSPAKASDDGDVPTSALDAAAVAGDNTAPIMPDAKDKQPDAEDKQPDDAKKKAASAKKPAAHRTVHRARKKRAGGAKSSCGMGTCV